MKIEVGKSYITSQGDIYNIFFEILGTITTEILYVGNRGINYMIFDSCGISMSKDYNLIKEFIKLPEYRAGDKFVIDYSEYTVSRPEPVKLCYIGPKKFVLMCDNGKAWDVPFDVEVEETVLISEMNIGSNWTITPVS